MQKYIFKIIMLFMFIIISSCGDKANKSSENGISGTQKDDRIKSLEVELTTYATTYTNLNNEVDLSVSNSSLKEFIRGIALANQLNVTIAPNITNTITNNFSKAKVIDVFVYLCVVLHCSEVSRIKTIIIIIFSTAKCKNDKAY